MPCSLKQAGDPHCKVANLMMTMMIFMMMLMMTLMMFVDDDEDVMMMFMMMMIMMLNLVATQTARLQAGVFNVSFMTSATMLRIQ